MAAPGSVLVLRECRGNVGGATDALEVEIVVREERRIRWIMRTAVTC
jgi:hypothetical protein